MEAGRFAHALLQDLPGVSPELRPAAAEQFLARNAGALSPAQREAIAERVLAALALPELAALFGPGSLAEVAIAGALPRPSLPDLAFSGRIDRLAVLEDSIIVADFKTGENTASTTKAGYIAQLALYRAALAPLYPDKSVRALLVWLDLGRIEEIPASTLDEALHRLLQQR
jgi:ATP-dependent helicase/nuclease subunit A